MDYLGSVIWSSSFRFEGKAFPCFISSPCIMECHLPPGLDIKQCYLVLIFKLPRHTNTTKTFGLLVVIGSFYLPWQLLISSSVPQVESYTGCGFVITTQQYVLPSACIWQTFLDQEDIYIFIVSSYFQNSIAFISRWAIGFHCSLGFPNAYCTCSQGRGTSHMSE